MAAPCGTQDLSLYIYTYIYIYIERERERENEWVIVPEATLHGTVHQDFCHASCELVLY